MIRPWGRDIRVMEEDLEATYLSVRRRANYPVFPDQKHERYLQMTMASSESDDFCARFAPVLQFSLSWKFGHLSDKLAEREDEDDPLIWQRQLTAHIQPTTGRRAPNYCKSPQIAADLEKVPAKKLCGGL